MTAADVVEALEAQRSGDSLRMRLLFDTAKAHADLPIPEIHELLDHPAYEPRMAAFCILDFQARRRLGVASATTNAARSTTSTSAGTTGSPPGTWSTGPLRASSAAT